MAAVVGDGEEEASVVSAAGRLFSGLDLIGSASELRTALGDDWVVVAAVVSEATEEALEPSEVCTVVVSDELSDDPLLASDAEALDVVSDKPAEEDPAVVASDVESDEEVSVDDATVVVSDEAASDDELPVVESVNIPDVSEEGSEEVAVEVASDEERLVASDVASEDD